MANSVDPDEMACYEPSHRDLHCLHGYWFWSAGLKGLIGIFIAGVLHGAIFRKFFPVV